MPYPATGTERARPDLADTLFEFDLAMNMAGMVALDVFPIRDVPVYKGDFGRVLLKEHLKRPTTSTSNEPGKAYKRAPRSAYATEETSFTKDTYETEEYGLEGFVDDWERDAYRDYFEQETFVTQFIQNQLLTQMEERVEAACFNTTTFNPGNGNGEDLTGGELWDQHTTADPVRQVREGRQGVYNNSGVWPDSIIMNEFAWQNLIETDDIRQRVHSQGSGSEDRQELITRRIVGQILGLQNVFVAGATYDAANPNQPVNPAQIWGPHALIYKQAQTRNLREVALGRTFHWAIDDSMPMGFVEDYRHPETRSMKIRIRHQMENRMLYSAVGWLLNSVYTP